MNLYTLEKLREIDTELSVHRMSLPQPPEKPHRKSVFGPLAATAGRTLRRFGEGLESWGTSPRAENDQPMQG